MTTYNIDWQSGGTEGLTGKEDILLPSGSTDITSTSIPLTGRGLSNYGEIQQENFIRLMENFSSATAPNTPTIGQHWFNPFENILYIAVDPAQVPGGQTTYDLSVVNPHGLVWIQTWPSPEGAVFAGREEYNALATRINRVLGAPETYPSLTAVPLARPATHAWGWGQTGLMQTNLDTTPAASTFYNLLPIFSDANNAQIPGHPSQPWPFDNRAWCQLIAVLHKAGQAIHYDLGIVDPSDPDLAITDTSDPAYITPEKRLFWGMINDGRGGNTAGTAARDTVHSTTFEFGGAGVAPATFLEPGWGGRGTAFKIEEWSQLNAAVRLLEDGRFYFTQDLFELQAGTGAATTIGTWGPQVQQVTTVTFPTLADAEAFFNTGGALRLVASSNDNTVKAGGDQTWQTFLANTVSGLQLNFYGIGKMEAYPSPWTTYPANNFVATNLGFYDLVALFTSSPAVTSFQKIFSENRSAATAYAPPTGSGVEIEARITSVSPSCVLELRVTYRENDGVADTVTDLSSAFWSYKKDEVNMNAPVLAHPTVVHSAFTGTYTP